MLNSRVCLLSNVTITERDIQPRVSGTIETQTVASPWAGTFVGAHSISKQVHDGTICFTATSAEVLFFNCNDSVYFLRSRNFSIVISGLIATTLRIKCFSFKIGITERK